MFKRFIPTTKQLHNLLAKFSGFIVKLIQNVGMIIFSLKIIKKKKKLASTHAWGSFFIGFNVKIFYESQFGLSICSIILCYW